MAGKGKKTYVNYYELKDSLICAGLDKVEADIIKTYAGWIDKAKSEEEKQELRDSVKDAIYRAKKGFVYNVILGGDPNESRRLREIYLDMIKREHDKAIYNNYDEDYKKYLDKDIECFDIYKERKVNSYVGTSNLFTNINMVPKEYLPDIKLNYDYIFNGLDGLSETYKDKCKKILEWRLDYIESLRNKE